MFVLDILRAKQEMPDQNHALTGREEPVDSGTHHAVSGNKLHAPYPDGLKKAVFGMGCFWGVERIFWQLDGVHVTAVGYAGGYTANATYNEICTGRTGHNEVVLVVFDPEVVSYEALLKVFWEGHEPTQGMRQGNDMGTQYRSGIYTFDNEQKTSAKASKRAFQDALAASGHKGTITTEIIDAPQFYYAEEYHQQYLHKNPNGYCGLGGTGVSCPIGVSQFTG